MGCLSVAAAPTLNPLAGYPLAMAKKDGPSFGWLYVGLGVVAAVGAGYIAWRYLLDESTKQGIRNTTTTVLKRSKDMADEASGIALETGRQATREAVTRVRNM